MLTTSVFAKREPIRRYLKPFEQVRARLAPFLFPSASDNWLAILRIGLGLQVVLYCLSLRRDWNHLFAQNDVGWISRDLLETILRAQAPLAPRFGWLLNIGTRLGLSEDTVIAATWLCLLGASCSLLLGFFSRSSAIITWFVHLCAVSSGGILTYGMDNFTTIGLFYLTLAPFPDRCSLDWKLWKGSIKDR